VILGFSGVNLVAGEVDRPDAVDRFVEQGFRALKSISNSYPYDHDTYWPLYERADQLRLPILFHTG
jgi:predicted TIM-barrel fold metal-dependent hydrolase